MTRTFSPIWESLSATLSAGSFVSIPALAAAPLVFLALFAGKIMSKIFGLYPVIRAFKPDRNESWYYTLMMSTGLTFGTISALFGLTQGLVTQEQYSHLVAVIVASAVIPTLIANAAFLPRHLLSKDEPEIGAALKMICALPPAEEHGEQA